MTQAKLFVAIATIYMISCATSRPSEDIGSVESKPKNIDNICSIFNEKSHWIGDASNSHEKWGIPVELMMAIIRHESSFRAAARPLDSRGRRISSALGYAQAIDGTWNIYRRENNKHRAKRTSFTNAIDFVGWYSSKSIKKGDDISPFDVNALYVFYHDGWEALPEDGSRELKSEVLKVAAKVYKRTLLYHRQLKDCPAIADALYSQGVATWNSDNKKNKKRNSSSNKKTNWF